ncbi:MAG: DUF4365 domain-containing protein [Dehalococcoidia bacterium]
MNDRKEQFSHAYLRAVASAAGLAVMRNEVDRNSVDVYVHAVDASFGVKQPLIGVQLKCSSTVRLDADTLSFPLSRKN